MGVDQMQIGTDLELSGLEAIDILELEEHLPEGIVTRVEGTQSRSTDYGDLGLTSALVFLSAAVVHGLAVWLVKRRVAVHQLTEVTVDESPGRRTIHLRIENTGSLSEAPPADVVASLEAKLTGLIGNQAS
jgi:hypothetical protein